MNRCKPIPVIPERAKIDFLSKVDQRAAGQCWPFLGALTPKGYGRLYLKGLPGGWAAHRIAYALRHGSPDPSLVIDHICRNRACCNPAHLRLVTNTENVLCGISPVAENARKTHCPRDHGYTPENTRIRRGKRYCKICHQASKIISYARSLDPMLRDILYESLRAEQRTPDPVLGVAVEAAYREGYYEGGRDEGQSGRDYTADKSWEYSDARAALQTINEGE